MAYEGQFGGALPEQILAAKSQSDLAGILFQAASYFGFPYIWCGAHADPFNVPPGAVLFQNYPAEWVREYVAKRYYSQDPVFKRAESTKEWFSWENPEFLSRLGERQLRMLSEALRHGIVGGITFPLNGQGCVAASCTLIPKDGEWRPSALTAMISIAWFVYGRGLLLSQAAKPAELDGRLSPRERDCLRLKARGASVEEIGAGLGIAGSTVRRHLDRAQIRLSARSREQAVAVALRQGQIS
jgi:DNA-binding CsgD family transcriptional regulator